MPLAAVAQESEDGGGFLTRTIEGLLSGAGREVRLEGFAGALSSEASFERLTIADDQGVWLTVEDVTLVWSRLSLLRGQLQVDRLTARSIDLPRLSQAPAEETVDIPDAEAKPFALPELPVSVNIDEVSIEKVTIGEPVIGVAAELALKASAQLDDDAARLDLLAERLDGQTGRSGIIAGFVRDTSEITVDVDLTEDAGGLVAGLMNLPGRPSVGLKVAGAGPIVPSPKRGDRNNRLEGTSQSQITSLLPAAASSKRSSLARSSSSARLRSVMSRLMPVRRIG